MHEYALIASVVDSILQELGSRKAALKVREIALKVGALELHDEETFKQVFAVQAKGTPLEGASIKLVVVPARIKCECGHEGPAGEGVDHHADLPVAECPSCGRLCRVEGGRGVEGIELDVEERPPLKGAGGRPSGTTGRGPHPPRGGQDRRH